MKIQNRGRFMRFAALSLVAVFAVAALAVHAFSGSSTAKTAATADVRRPVVQMQGTVPFEGGTMVQLSADVDFMGLAPGNYHAYFEIGKGKPGFDEPIGDTGAIANFTKPNGWNSVDVYLAGLEPNTDYSARLRVVNNTDPQDWYVSTKDYFKTAPAGPAALANGAKTKQPGELKTLKLIPHQPTH